MFCVTQVLFIWLVFLRVNELIVGAPFAQCRSLITMPLLFDPILTGSSSTGAHVFLVGGC